MDIKSKEERSLNMSKIKGTNTSIEIIVRKLLHAKGYRYRIHNKKIIGKPDLYLSKYKTAVFIHGCFWHRHKSCKLAYMPKSNVEFWKEKFEKNIERDNRVITELNKSGIKVIIIWECTVKKLGEQEFRDQFLMKFLQGISSNELLTEI